MQCSSRIPRSHDGRWHFGAKLTKMAECTLTRVKVYCISSKPLSQGCLQI